MTQKVYNTLYLIGFFGRDADYETARTAAVGISNLGSFQLGQTQYPNPSGGPPPYLYKVIRMHYSFDQSADKIPADATITSVVVNLHGFNPGTGGEGLSIVAGFNETGWFLNFVSAIGCLTTFRASDYGLLMASNVAFYSLADTLCSGDIDATLNADGIADIQSQIALSPDALMLGARLSTDINFQAPAYVNYGDPAQELVNMLPAPTITIDYTEASPPPVVVAPTVETDAATAIIGTQATLNGTLNDDGGEACFCQFVYGTDPTLLNIGGVTNGIPSVSTSQTFSDDATGLTPDTVYYFHAIADNSAPGVALGNILSFTTPGAIPILGLPTVLSIGRYNATLECVLIDDGGEACTLGFTWGTDANNLLNSVTVFTGGHTGLDFSVNILTLQPDTTYFFEAFAVNTDGLTVVSQVVSFHTDGALEALPIPLGPPNPIFPITPNPIINFANIGLAVGGTAGAMTLLFPSDDEKKKKKKQLNGANNGTSSPPANI